MLQTRVSRPELRRVVARARTRVVFPAPWTPLRPIMKGRVGEEEDEVAAWCRERRERMKGIQCGDLSSIIWGGEVGVALSEVAIVRVWKLECYAAAIEESMARNIQITS